MFERTITIGSAGKTFSVTGWKLGWAIAPEKLLEPLKVVHQNCVYTCPTVLQEVIAQAFERELELFKTAPEKSYLKTQLAADLQVKRDRMAIMLQAVGMKPVIPDSGYFMMADYTSVDGPYKVAACEDDEPLDFHFARWICKEKKLAVIPPSTFYSEKYKKDNQNMIRVCFFKSEKTFRDVERILKNLPSGEDDNY